MTSYLVTGDLHLDKYQYGLTIRHQDNLSCIEHMVAETLARSDLKGLILTGDTFNKRSILPRFQLFMRDVYRRCADAQKELLAIDGNHDASDASWLDTINPQINQHRKTRLLGNTKAVFFSFQSREQLYAELKNHTDCKLVFLHGKLLELMPWVKAQEAAGSNHEFSAAEVRELGFINTTFLLGDIHTYCDYHDPVANNWFVYPGSPEMTDLNEGHVLSTRFGPHYSAQKHYLVLYPDREPGLNWERRDLPNRPYWRRTVDDKEEPGALVAQLDQWVENHPQGILALHFPQKFAPDLQGPIARWRSKLLLLFDTILYPSISKQLQDLKETDILEIAKEELSDRQVELLTLVLTQENFNPAIEGLLQSEKTEVPSPLGSNNNP